MTPLPGTRRLSVAIALAALALTSASTGPAVSAQAWPGPRPAAADWPQYLRGSFHESWNRAESALTPEAASTLTRSWGHTVAGLAASASSPLVVGNAIYVAGRSLKRLSTAAGGVRWTFTLPAGRTIGMTPAYDRGIVVAVDNDDTGAVAGITAVSAASGTVLWRRTVVGGSAPASPSIAADRVYFPLYLDGIGVEMLALSLRTGATLWSWVPDVRQGLPSSPATDGHTVVLAMDGGLSAAGLDAVTGHELWRSAWGYNAPFHGTDGYAMALMGGRAYLSDHFGNLRALDARTGTQAWSVTLPTFTAWGVQATPGALLVNGVQSLVAVSPANGIILWTATGTSFTGGQGPASTAAGVVYSLQGYAYNSTVLLARRLSDGTVLAQFTLPRPVYQSTVAISRDRIYVQDAGRVIAYAPAS